MDSFFTLKSRKAGLTAVPHLLSGGHVTGDATRTRMPGSTAAQESAPYASGGVNCLSDVTCLWRYKSSCPRHRAGQPSDYDFAHL